MPWEASPAVHDDATYHLGLRIPGWLKNRLLAAADADGVGLAAWCQNILLGAVERHEGLPLAPPARAPLPTTADQIRAWALGETLLTPCGKQGTCTGTEASPRVVGGVHYCAECRIRIS